MPELVATPASNDPAQGGADQSLPDPSVRARALLAVLLGVAAVVAVAMNAGHVTALAFAPPKGEISFSLFAGFYAGAQIIERLMELVAPLLPSFPPAGAVGNVRAAHVKADRAKLTLGVAAVLGVAASAAFGLSSWASSASTRATRIDTLVTGILIASGTKPLHDFITLLQKPNTPPTGTKLA